MQECKGQVQGHCVFEGDIRNDYASKGFSCEVFDEVEYDPQLDAFQGFSVIAFILTIMHMSSGLFFRNKYLW